MDTIQFGYHLTLDLYNCNPKLLGNMEHCYKALNETVSLLKMKALTPPFVISASSNEISGGKDPGGFSGFVIIAESHISLHTFIKRGFASIDVYSCVKFDKTLATRYFIKTFESKDEEINFIKRGSRYPEENIY